MSIAWWHRFSAPTGLRGDSRGERLDVRGEQLDLRGPYVPVGGENLCHLGGCPAASGAGLAGAGLAGGGMIFGLWA